MRIYFITFLLSLFLISCAPVEEFNRPASFWYEKIIIEISRGNLERADNYFNSLQSEHIASPLIGEALLMLSKAHMDNNEHLLAGFFANEYKVRFSNPKNSDYVSFLSIESSYYAFVNYSKDQGYINDNIKEVSNFIILNTNNKYLPYIKHILTTFKLSSLEINKEIIRIYTLQDKILADEKYKQYNKDLGVSSVEFTPSYVPWYVKIFSW